MIKIIVVIYGDVDFDGRAKRIIDTVSSMGHLKVIDAAECISRRQENFDHIRVLLRPEWGVVRRHLKFWRSVIGEAIVYRPHIIFSLNFFTAFPGWIAARLTRSKLVYDAYELIIPESSKKMSLRNRIWYGLERFVAPRADMVITANPERGEIMAQHYGLANPPTYMRNIPPMHEVTPEQRAEAVKRYPELKKRNKHECVLLYQGDVSLSRGLGRFIDVLDHLPSVYRMIVVGSGPDLEQIKGLAKRHVKSGRFIFLGRIPSDALPSVTVNCDIGIVTYSKKDLNNIYCAPNKIFEYAQAGLPVISSDNVTLRNFLKNLNLSQIFTDSDSSQEIAKRVLIIDKNIDLAKKEIRNLLTEYNFSQEKDRIQEALKSIID